MSDLKSIVKGGWHPKGKDGGKESWRGDFKGIDQVASWMGKGKSSEVEKASAHMSRPLATLKDPSSFGPPPKNVNYHGGAALPNEITPHRSGLGAPLTQQEIQGTRTNAASPNVQEHEEEEPSKPVTPALPYRVDTTGYKTSHLPPPPVHRNVQQPTSFVANQPRLPPRLPSRQTTGIISPSVAEQPPPSYDNVTVQQPPAPYISQTAVDNLGRVGVNVPAFGIGKTEPNPWTQEKSPPQGPSGGQLSTLQSKFASMQSLSQEKGISSASNSSTPAPESLPSWKQSQSAFQTAQNLRNNPQSVTLADAQSAAQTANQTQKSASAFKERHADSIAKGQAKAKAWDQRYKVTSKINRFLDDSPDQSPNQPQQQLAQPSPTYTTPPQLPRHPSTIQQPVQPPPLAELSASISRKPPPPPAPRKPANLQAPPPVPTGTKPSFG